MEIVLFYGIVGLVLASGAAVVLLKNLVHAGLWLIVCFLGVACLFLMLQSDLLFAIQLTIYAGAIPILLLFVLMLTREVMSVEQRAHSRMWPLGTGTALAFLVIALPKTEGMSTSAALPPVPTDLTEQIGRGFLGEYVLPFEVASLLLLAALVGAIYLARAEKAPAMANRDKTPTEEKIGRDTASALADRSNVAV
ncbi:MAG: NADH-quinone oxidoreductase subunit J [Fimbriimonadia bacterium]|jgi:NADH:ubiquinone oxidoreductase subunit 6 (subunit J)